MTNQAKVTCANMDFTRGRNRAYIRQLCEWSHVLLLQEAKDFRLAELLPPGWVGKQDTSSDAKAGSCIAFDQERFRSHNFHLVYGCGAPPDAGMLPRWIAVVDLEFREQPDCWFTAISAHEPPARYGGMQPEYTKNLKAARAEGRQTVVGTDANMPLPDLAKQIGGKPYGYGIVGNITDQRVEWKQRHDWASRKSASDHPAVTCLVTWD